jgi:dCMP deaminase
MERVERPDRDTYFMLMARTASLRGTCSRRFVGAVAVDEQYRVRGTGHNGAPPGIVHCYHPEGDKEPCLTSDHAEYNTIVHGGARGHTMYCTDGACLRCAKLLVAAGFKRFVYHYPFRDTAGVEWLEARIDVVGWEVPPAWSALWSSMGEATTSYGRRIT